MRITCLGDQGSVTAGTLDTTLAQHQKRVRRNVSNLDIQHDCTIGTMLLFWVSVIIELSQLGKLDHQPPPLILAHHFITLNLLDIHRFLVLCHLVYKYDSFSLVGRFTYIVNSISQHLFYLQDKKTLFCTCYKYFLP